MIIFDDNRSRTALQQLDPRVRVLVTLVWTVMACLCDRPAVLGLLLGAAVGLVLWSRLPLDAIGRRLVHLNLFTLLLVLLLPLTFPGPALTSIGPLAWSEDGLVRALLIGVRANSIVLTCAALLGTMEAAHLALALRQLGVSAKLVQVFLFMVRYTETIHREYHRLRDAMRLRAFTAKCNQHTLRSLGHLIGMLLVRSAERSDRILAAMKCRGFQGKLYVLERFRMTGSDYLFACGLATWLLILGCLQWT